MPYELKVRKIGNSYGVVLPKEALATLRVKEGDTLTATEAPHLSRRYRNALRELAK